MSTEKPENGKTVKSKSTSRRLWYTAAPIALGVLAVAGIGAAAADNASGPIDPTKTMNLHSGDPVTYAHDANAPAKGLAPDSATRQVVEGLGASSHVQDATLSQGANGTTITVNLNRNDDDVTSQWESELAVGAIGELMRSNQATLSDEIFSATAVGPNRAGVPTTTGLGVGAATLGQQFASPSDATLTAHASDVGQQFGLKIGALEVQHPLDSAVKVTYVVPDDANVNWTIDDLRTALVGSTPNVEGAYIELDSPSGGPLLRSAVSYRTANGVLWFAPGQDDRFGADHGDLDTTSSQ